MQRAKALIRHTFARADLSHHPVDMPRTGFHGTQLINKDLITGIKSSDLKYPTGTMYKAITYYRLLSELEISDKF